MGPQHQDCSNLGQSIIPSRLKSWTYQTVKMKSSEVVGILTPSVLSFILIEYPPILKGPILIYTELH